MQTTQLAILALLTATFAKSASVYNFNSFDGPGLNAGGTTVDGIDNNGAIVRFSSNNAVNPSLFTNFIRNANGTFNSVNINNDPVAMANGINNSNTIVGVSNNQAFAQTGSALITDRVSRS